MIHTDTMMNTKNVFSQLFQFLLCMILLLSALPFIGLAAIFSIFTDIPHIKIELGQDNIVESVVFRTKREVKYESDSDEEEEEDDDVIPNDELADFLDLEHDEQTTLSNITSLLNTYIEEYGATGTQKINYDPKLWRLLKLTDRSLTYKKMGIIISKMYTVVSEDSGNDADDEADVEAKEVSPKGRVGGFEDNYPVTPVRSSSPHDTPHAPQKRINIDINSPSTPPLLDMAQLHSLLTEQFNLHTDVLAKLRASTDENDGDLTPIPSESSSLADGEQTPSECPPSS